MPAPHALPDPVDLTLALCRIDSTTGREGEAAAFVAETLRGLGFTVETQPVPGGTDGAAPRVNVLATTDAEPLVVLSTHLDTVPPFIAPRIEGPDLVGRGVVDAKGIAATMIAAAARLLEAGERRIGLLFTVDEEAASVGARAANGHAMGARVRFLVNGEPTDGRLAAGTKGSLRVRLVATGRAGHSAYPESGRAATHDLVAILHDVLAATGPTDPLFGETTINVGTMAGGVAANVLAPSAEAVLQLRLVTPPAEAEAWLRGVVRDRCAVEVLSSSTPVRLHVPEGWPGETAVMRYTTDVPYLSDWGTPLLFGAGSILVAHTDDERIATADVHAAMDAYVALVRTLLRG